MTVGEFIKELVLECAGDLDMQLVILDPASGIRPAFDTQYGYDWYGNEALFLELDFNQD